MAFAALKEALDAHDTWDAVTSKIELCGWERQGMRRFERFQKRASRQRVGGRRFIEIPALRATALSGVPRSWSFRTRRTQTLCTETSGQILKVSWWIRLS